MGHYLLDNPHNNFYKMTAYTYLVRKLEQNKPFRRCNIYGWIILKWILKKQYVTKWIGLNWLSIWSSSSLSTYTDTDMPHRPQEEVCSSSQQYITFRKYEWKVVRQHSIRRKYTNKQITYTITLLKFMYLIFQDGYFFTTLKNMFYHIK
jgi:hypothetical protein